MTPDELRRAMERTYVEMLEELHVGDTRLAWSDRRTYFFLAAWHQLAAHEFLTMDMGELVAFGGIII